MMAKQFIAMPVSPARCPLGLMDKASDLQSEDCGLKSRRGCYDNRERRTGPVLTQRLCQLAARPPSPCLFGRADSRRMHPRTRARARTHLHTRRHELARMHASTDAHTHACTRVSMHAQTHARQRTHTCTQARTRVHTHTHRYHVRDVPPCVVWRRAVSSSSRLPGQGSGPDAAYPHPRTDGAVLTLTAELAPCAPLA